MGPGERKARGIGERANSRLRECSSRFGRAAVNATNTTTVSVQRALTERQRAALAAETGAS